jgi:hypothetical protein
MLDEQDIKNLMEEMKKIFATKEDFNHFFKHMHERIKELDKQLKQAASKIAVEYKV